jgi:hypothetical protein
MDPWLSTAAGPDELMPSLRQRAASRARFRHHQKWPRARKFWRALKHALEDLAAHQVVTRTQAKANVHLWTLNADILEDYQVIKAFSEMSHEVPT